MKRSLNLLALAGVIAGCGGANGPVPDVVGERSTSPRVRWPTRDRRCDAAPSAVEETTSAAAEPAATKRKAAVKRPKAAPVRARRIRVPNVVGMDHQLAQDTMQAAGLYMLAERDASGQGRLLLYDRNWTVVRQSPKPGARVSEERTITLYSIKDDER